MPRALITGIGGFVGPFLKSELSQYEVFGLERRPVDDPAVVQADITNIDQVQTALGDIKPDVIFHLAGFSSVAESWSEQALVRKINVEGTLHVLQAAQKLTAQPRVVLVSSSEAYGIPESIPIKEGQPLRAVSPYGKSRAEQELAGLATYKNLVVSRSFNHTGPGQPPTFVVPSFIGQALLVQQGSESKVKVGNTEAVRDFSDVRDVVRAYRLLAERGLAGQTYNVCSGIGYSIDTVLQKILQLTSLSPDVVVHDPDRMHPSDIPKLIGDHAKITAATGWQPELNFLDRTIPDTVEYARRLMSATS